MFGRWRGSGYRRIDYREPNKNTFLFEHVADLLRADVTVVNLETPLLRKLPERSYWDDNARFVATPEQAGQLVRAGVDVVTIANNHIWDSHQVGAIGTAPILEEIGITTCGAPQMKKPAFRTVTVTERGWRIAFVCAMTATNWEPRGKTPWFPEMHFKQVTRHLAGLVTEARPDHDLVIVQIHWGEEEQEEPVWYQKRAAHELVDAGADVIIGHHSHVLQGIERYKGAIIAYSVGNFLFDYGRIINRQTGVLRVRFRAAGNCLSRATFHPVYLDPFPVWHPRPLPAKHWLAEQIRARIIGKSRKLDTNWTADGDLLVTAPGCDAG